VIAVAVGLDDETGAAPEEVDDVVADRDIDLRAG
jgi:hypothetical protein